MLVNDALTLTLNFIFHWMDQCQWSQGHSRDFFLPHRSRCRGTLIGTRSLGDLYTVRIYSRILSHIVEANIRYEQIIYNTHCIIMWQGSLPIGGRLVGCNAMDASYLWMDYIVVFFLGLCR